MSSTRERVDEALAWLEQRGSKRFREEMLTRYGDRWVRDFDSWAICDTVCFHLFDRTAHG